MDRWLKTSILSFTLPLIIVFGSVAIIYMYPEYSEYRMIKKAERIIEALETYKDANGHYPNKLDALKSEFMNAIPNPNWGDNEWGYNSYNGLSTGFSLYIRKDREFGWDSYQYNSTTSEWTHHEADLSF